MGDDRYHQLFEQSPGAIVTVDRDGHIVDCNRSACLLLAHSRSELLGTPVLQWVLPAERPATKDLYLRAFEGQMVEWRTKVRRGDGVVRSLSLRAVPVLAGGEVASVNTFVREPAHERVGRPDHARLLNLLENLPGQFVVVLDAGGRIRHSAGLARTHWLDDKECLGRDFGSLLDMAAENRRLYDGLRADVAKGQKWVGVLWHVRADESLFPAKMFAVPHLDGGTDDVIGLLIAGRDVAVDQEGALKLERAERLAAVGELVVSIAREISQPLLQIQTQSQLLLKEAADLGTRDRVEQISLEAGRSGVLVEALLAFVREEAGERTACDLGAVVGEALAAELVESDRSRVRVTNALPDDLPAAQADSELLRRLFAAVLANALEAVDGRPDPQIRIDSVRHNQIVVVRVQDNGQGIREDWKERVFEPFFTTKKAHLGLGLSIARAIARAHGGRVWVDRSRDGWTRVSVELQTTTTSPADGQPAPSSAFRPVPLLLSRARSVLLVDDEESIRTVVRLSLEKVGYQVTEAWSGRSALARITSGSPPELIVTDLRMSDGNGYWLIDQLVRDFPELLRRTILMTGHPTHETVEKIVRETGCPVVPKPLDFTLLLEAIDEVAMRI